VKVIVVEDEQRIAQFLRKGLTEKGYAVETVGDADAALERIAAVGPDLVILDLMLPGSRDGLELCRELRARGVRAKILMLTARDTVENKIEGLDAGADDYLVKPFSFRELMARMRALLRRTEVIEPGPLVYPDLTYDPESREVRREGETLRLTMREGALFELLLRRRGKVVPRSEIQARIWEDSFDLSTNIIDVYINSLRKKLDGGVIEKAEALRAGRTRRTSGPVAVEATRGELQANDLRPSFPVNPEPAEPRAVPGGKRLIQTVRGVGYRLREPDPKSDA
jgi:DNA-binding response OmpR family regulator